MSAEKSDALVIRLADFSESSRVVTFFSRDFGKLAVIAKGAKRLKGPFEAALDLLAVCRIVFLRKSSGGLDILTEAQLHHKFRPPGHDLIPLYAGYYVAELLDGLTEEHDPHPRLFEAAVRSLERFTTGQDTRLPVIQFELTVLHEIGQLPAFDACSVCGQPVGAGRMRYWVSQGGLICANCGRPEFEHSEVHPGTIAILNRLAEGDDRVLERLAVSPQQFRELRRIMTPAMSHVLERRPKMLKYLKFD